MTGLLDSAVTLQRRLDLAGIPSMVIGGLAVAVWGEPRMTRDADLKVQLGRDSAQRLLDVLGDDYKPLQEHPLASLRTLGRSQVRPSMSLGTPDAQAGGAPR